MAEIKDQKPAAPYDIEQFKALFQKINPFIDSFSDDVTGNHEYFRQALKAAFIKSYELCVAMTQTDILKDFFMIAALRGVCEDCIALRFLYKICPNNKDEIVRLKIEEESLKSSLVQWEFFKTHHPEQMLYYKVEFETQLETVEMALRNAMSHHLKGKPRTMPTAFYMAKQTQLTPLYNYLYHATSSLVHFNPRMLFRMGWGDLPKVKFTVSHFAKYYQHFGVFYSAYLFKEMATLLNENQVGLEVESLIQNIGDLLRREHRWPELVTFEEMNIGVLSKMLFFKAPADIKP